MGGGPGEGIDRSSDLDRLGVSSGHFLNTKHLSCSSNALRRQPASEALLSDGLEVAYLGATGYNKIQ